MASTKISDMTAATDVTDAVVPIVQDGVNKKADTSLFGGGWATSGQTFLPGDVEVIRPNYESDYSALSLFNNQASLDISDSTNSRTAQLSVLDSFTYAEFPQTLNVAYNELSQPTLISVVSNGKVEVSSGVSGFQGATYDLDYSSDFVNRSLVDKEYVDTEVSDEKLKENIVNIDSSLAKINSLRPVEFDMKKDGEHKAGFIAQELQQVFPGMIVEGEYLKIKKDQLIPYMVKAIQELSKEVELLKSKI
jgi:hypothetical protein